MKKTLWTVVPVLLIVAFVAGGLLIRNQTINKENQYTQMVEQALSEQAAAQTAYDGVDTSAVDALNGQLETIQKDNAALEESITALTAENDTLDQKLSAAKAEYDRLAQEEENAYYLTVCEAVAEGKAKVEELINNP